MAVAALAIGAGISAYSSYEAGIEKQQAYELSAQSRRAQAAEVQIGADREIQLTRQRADMIKGAQISAVGSSGTTLAGTNLLQLEQNAKNAYDQVASIQQAAGYRGSTLLVDAGQDQVLGHQAYNAGQLNAFGSVVGGYGQYAKATGGYP